MNKVKDKHRRINFLKNERVAGIDRKIFIAYIEGDIDIPEACERMGENNKCTVTPTQFTFEAHNCGYFTQEERNKLFRVGLLQ